MSQTFVNPVVSVCVPTYNGAAYLAECLDSILAQTFDDFEVLVVDDCSNDDTVAIAEGYARRDSRVRVHRNARNLGLVGNWNRCVEIARGEWIKFVFQDDLIAPTCLERMLAVGERGHLIVACARDFIFAPGTRERDQEYFLWHQALVDGLLSESTTATRFSELTLDDVDTNLLGEPTAVLLQRRAFERFGLFNERMVQFVDSEYWARVGTSVGVGYVRDVLATFRVHAESTSTLNNGARKARARLDPLVVRHEYAFNPVYAPLRAVRARTRPHVDLERWFWEGAYLVLVKDGVAAALKHADSRSKAGAEQVYAAYPRLRRARRYAFRHLISQLRVRPRIVHRAVQMLREQGPAGTAARAVAVAYRRGVRPLLPTRAIRYGGVPIARDRKWGDALVPESWSASDVADVPDYEVELIKSLRRHVRGGDRVVVVGGGFGVTAVVAAQCAGAGGRVHCYEGAAENTEMVRRAAARSGVSDRLTVEHAVVARAVEVYGRQPEDGVVAPEALPACDVLEMDCEGAERDILEALVIRPRVIIVETHGLYGAPTPLVVEHLDRLGYRPEVGDVAEPRLRAFCEEKDIRIVTAVRDGG